MHIRSPAVLSVFLFIVLTLYFNAIIFLCRLLRYLTLESINYVTIRVVTTAVAICASRALFLSLQFGRKGSFFAQLNGFVGNLMDQAFLWFIFWFVDLNHTLPDLVERECYQYKQYWSRWIKDLIMRNRLIPTSASVSDQWTVEKDLATLEYSIEYFYRKRKFKDKTNIYFFTHFSVPNKI